MQINVADTLLYFLSILVYLFLTVFYSRFGELEKNTKLQILMGACLCMGMMIFDGIHQAVWSVLVFQMYNDITTHTVICKPITAVTAVMTVWLLISKTQGNILNALTLFAAMLVLAALIYIPSKLPVFMYAEGDADIFLMIAVCSALCDKNPVIYFIKTLYLSGCVFIIEVLVINAIRFISSKVRKVKYRVVRRAAMVPAIAFAYLVIFYCEVNSVHLYM